MNTTRFVALLALSPIGIAAAQQPPDRFYFEEGKIRVLILSGRNNHDWRASTPHLRRILDATGKFDVRVTEEPSGLTSESLRPMMSWLPTIAAHAGRSGRGRRRSICTVGQGIGRRSCRVIPIRHPQRPRRKDGQYGISSSPGRPGPKWSGKLAGGERCQRYPKDRPRRRHVYDVKWKDPAHPVAAGLEPSLTTSDDSISASSSHVDPHPRHRLHAKEEGAAALSSL